MRTRPVVVPAEQPRHLEMDGAVAVISLSPPGPNSHSTNVTIRTMRTCIRRLLVLSLLLCPQLTAEIRSLTILHTNDLHARLTPLDNHNGGFAYLATAIQREREHCNDCILLNAGDLVQGTPVSTIFHGLPVFEVGNLLGFDAACLGNHDFDYGWMQTQKFVQTANYPIVSSNLRNPKNEPFTSNPYVTLNF